MIPLVPEASTAQASTIHSAGEGTESGVSGLSNIADQAPKSKGSLPLPQRAGATSRGPNLLQHVGWVPGGGL